MTTLRYSNLTLNAASADSTQTSSVFSPKISPVNAIRFDEGFAIPDRNSLVRPVFELETTAQAIEVRSQSTDSNDEPVMITSYM